jgi:bifunctional non-homologous end joining protein LigD
MAGFALRQAFFLEPSTRRKGCMASRKTPTSRRLETYRAKRSAERTPEPFGTPSAVRPRLFVIQKHAATRLHYDFRIEWGGTLWSWAIPNGPSHDPKERRLAVQVEDHPVEYADFEGIIPKGNYGAGAVIVWDRGTWVPHDDPDAGLASGKLHFDLHGYKMHGEWILVRTKRGPKEWLFFKKADGYAAPEGTQPYDERSILSGLSLEELRDGTDRAATIRERLDELRVPHRRVDASKIKLMLAETADEPFSSPDWIFELKYDGYRLLAGRRSDGNAVLRYRSGLDATELFPDLAHAVRALPFAGLVLDGELVVLDDQGRPDFQRLQKRARLRRKSEIERGTVELPVTLFVFDVLGFEDRDLRELPLVERKEILRQILPASGPLRYADHVETRGTEMFEHVRKMGLEGVLAKKARSPYVPRRSPQWLKLVADRTADFVVVGFTDPQGTRAGLGALHLAARRAGELVYCGSVGTGFNDKQLEELRAALDPRTVKQPACAGEIPKTRGNWWVRPELVIEVRFKTWTDDGHLRHPVFVRVRDDKPPEECIHPLAGSEPEEPTDARAAEGAAMEDGMGATDDADVSARRAPSSKRRGATGRTPPARSAGKAGGATEHARPAAPEPDREVRFTRLEKVFWPREHYTKGDLVQFYRTIAPWLLPYLRDRPLVVTRYPDGIEGKSFYQKNAPDYVPDWIRRERIWSEHSEREIEYFVCDDIETLLYIANMGAIPLHIWSSRVEKIQHPDWCILDLDPKGAPFAHVVQLALAIGKLCKEIDLPAYVKTSGSTGLHVLVPLGGLCTYEQSRQLAHLLVRIVHQRHPDISTIARALTARRGKVYLDWLQNRHGQLLAAPFCVRPLPGAPVSTPLRWNEVNSKLRIETFDIRSVPTRLGRTKQDPMLPVLDQRPDLIGALERLAALLPPQR